MAYRSRQRVHGGGKFKSERQRRAMWANSPSAARKWAHNVSAAKDPSWPGMRRAAGHSGGPGLALRSAAGKAVRKSGSTRTKQRKARAPSRNRGRKA